VYLGQRQLQIWFLVGGFWLLQVLRLCESDSTQNVSRLFSLCELDSIWHGLVYFEKDRSLDFWEREAFVHFDGSRGYHCEGDLSHILLIIYKLDVCSFYFFWRTWDIEEMGKCKPKVASTYIKNKFSEKTNSQKKQILRKNKFSEKTNSQWLEIWGIRYPTP